MSMKERVRIVIRPVAAARAKTNGDRAPVSVRGQRNELIWVQSCGRAAHSCSEPAPPRLLAPRFSRQNEPLHYSPPPGRALAQLRAAQLHLRRFAAEPAAAGWIPA